MHPNPAFRSEPDFLHWNLVRTRGFGTLAVNGPEGPITAHLPLLFRASGDVVETHVMANAEICAALGGEMPCTVTISGPDGYISPDWYGDRAAHLPTWNYAAVQLRGRVRFAPEIALADYLVRFAESYEARLAPKTAWTAEKLPRNKLIQLQDAIRVLHFDVQQVQGTWKLCQDKSESAREGAAAHLRHSPLGQQTDVLAALMLGGGVTGLDF